LTLLQNKLLQDLQDSKDFIVILSKNHGPCSLEYIKQVLEHLSDAITYHELSSDEAQQAITNTDAMIEISSVITLMPSAQAIRYFLIAPTKSPILLPVSI
jgi:hypothetical protein